MATENSKVVESCLLGSSIDQVWAIIKSFKLNCMSSLISSVVPQDGASLGTEGSVCEITYQGEKENSKERIMILQIQETTFSMKFAVLDSAGGIITTRTMHLIPVSDRNVCYFEHKSEFRSTLTLKEFTEVKMKTKLFLKHLQVVFGVDDQTDWECGCGNVNLKGTCCCTSCKKTNYQQIKWSKIISMPYSCSSQYNSEIFDLLGYKWTLMIFPRGQDSQGFITAFLKANIPEHDRLSVEFFFAGSASSGASRPPRPPGRVQRDEE